MSHPTTAPTRQVAPQARIVSVEWERVQVTLQLAAVDEPLPDPATMRLRRRGHGHEGTVMAPTHVTPGDGALLLRFNVMQGPDRMPLDPGRWVLEAAGSPLVVDGAERADGAAARFPLREAEYRVTPVVDTVERCLALDVELDTSTSLVSQGLEPPRTVRQRVASSIVTPLRVAVFGVVHRVLRRIVRRNGRRILFSSDSRSELGGNMALVWDRMVELGLDREYRLATLFKPSMDVRRGFLDRLRMPWLLARADAIVIDDYQPVITRIPDGDTRIVQLWHAWGAFKTVGYSRVGKPGSVDPFGRVHKNYTYAIVSSEAEVPYYAEAFGIPEERVKPTGIPRMDRFFDPAARAAGREAAHAAYPGARGRTTILFAPTFRGFGARSATYDLRLLDYDALHRLCVEMDAVFIIRMHPFVTEPLAIPTAYRDRLIDGSGSAIDVNDLLFAVDLLITDYSSIVFEFSTLDRPMLFFAYDLEDYIASRDFYVRYEEFVPGRIVRTFDELVDAIRREDYGTERLASFRATWLDHFDGRATDRVIDLIVGR